VSGIKKILFVILLNEIVFAIIILFEFLRNAFSGAIRRKIYGMGLYKYFLTKQLII